MRTRPLARLLAPLALLATVAAACGDDAPERSGAATAPGSAGSAAGDPPPSTGPVTVYLGRHYGVEPVFEAFTRDTGIPVRFTTGKDPELRERLVVEGANTSADVYLAADAGNLELADRAGVLRPVRSRVLDEAVPGELRDGRGAWFGLSQRARTVVSSTERVPADEVPGGYGELGDPRWRGTLCLRPATHPYTQSLVAAQIELQGERDTEEMVREWVANEPTWIDSDTDILKAVAAGTCDVALVNSYYLPRLEAEVGPQPVRLTWPEDGGVHVNLSGAAVTKHAPNPGGAQRLLEWLATEGQRAFADANYEFPVNDGVAPRAELVELGDFTREDVDVERFGARQADAVRLLDRAGSQ